MSTSDAHKPMEYLAEDAPVLTDEIMALVQPPGKAPDLPEIAANDVGLSKGVVELIGKLLELKFKYAAELIKHLSKPTTTHNSGTDRRVTAGRPLLFGFDHADDEAEIIFNDEHVAHKTGSGLTWHTSTSVVRPGPNMLVLAVNNRGRLAWGTKVHVYDGETRQHIVTYNPWGNDGIFDNTHMYSVRFWGQ